MDSDLMDILCLDQMTGSSVTHARVIFLGFKRPC